MVSKVEIGTYEELMEVVIDASYWMRVHELEALAEEAFDLYAKNEPEPSFPYGRGFTGPMVLS